MKHIIILCALTGCLMASCKKTELMTYEGTDNIFFNNTTSDSATVSFYRDTTTYTDYEVTVKVWGNISDKNRLIKVAVDPSSTAVSGTHFVSLQDTFVVKANETTATIRIRLLKNKASVDEVFVLALKLLPNENFTIEPQPANALPDGRKLSKDLFRVYFGYKYFISPTWANYAGYTGAYSAKKVKLLMEISNMDLIRFYKKTVAEGAYKAPEMQALSRKLQAYLNSEKAKGNIIPDENGTPMKMGAAVQ
jgi:Domain of unknown function (DUF4843)